MSERTAHGAGADARAGGRIEDPAAPRFEIAAGVGPGFPGWWLRIALVVSSLSAVVLSLRVGAGPGVLTVLGFLMAALAIATVVVPNTIAPALLILGAMTGHLLGRDQGITVETGVLAVLLLAVHQLAGICAAVPARSIVHRPALRPALLRFALCGGAVLGAAVVVSLL